MHRLTITLAAALLGLPALASAQTPVMHLPTDQELPRLSITPFVALQAPYLSSGTFGHAAADGRWEFWTVEQTFEPAPAAGLQLQSHIGGPWGALASVSYSHGGDQRVRMEEWFDPTDPRDTEVVSEFRTVGQSLWMGRLAAYYLLPVPERDLRGFPVVGTVSAGPAVVRQEGRNPLGLANVTADPVYNFALNVGADATLPLDLLPGVALYAGFENYFTFWNTREWERREETVLGAGHVVEFDYSPTFLFLFRLGSSFSF